MTYFALYFEEIGGRFKTFQVITEAESKQEASLRVEEAKTLLPEYKCLYMGCVEVEENEIERRKENFPMLKSEVL